MLQHDTGQNRREKLEQRYDAVRTFSEELAAPLCSEDYVVQPMPDASPTKWHLAHTTWFFETFVLPEAAADYQPVDSRYAYLFNSYYVQAGDRFPRPKRGLISRPSVDEVQAYRREVDRRMREMLYSITEERLNAVAPRVVLGLHHEQQHQELILTDIKNVLAENPLNPRYSETDLPPVHAAPAPLLWVSFAGGNSWIGHEGEQFSFDNETPRHKYHLAEFSLANRLITNGEYLLFIEDGGYERQEIWLSDGWYKASTSGWNAPLYWRRAKDGDWRVFTLHGEQPLDLNAPVCHLSYYEADAYARWAGARLPSEQEWEVAAGTVPVAGNFAESRNFEPLPPGEGQTGLQQMFGDVWEWTQSPYTGYPGFKPVAGALGEYNGKFMCNQMVLRGGSCATSVSHIRKTYRNFFYPDSRWQFMGVRLAQ